MEGGGLRRGSRHDGGRSEEVTQSSGQKEVANELGKLSYVGIHEWQDVCGPHKIKTSQMHIITIRQLCWVGTYKRGLHAVLILLSGHEVKGVANH